MCGALAAGARGWVSARLLVGSALAFGVLLLAAAAAPTLGWQIAVLVPLGAVSVTFAAGVNSTLQLEVEPAMRGRVMALYSVVFLGSTPIGAPFVGWLAAGLGPAGRARGRRHRGADRRVRRPRGVHARRPGGGAAAGAATATPRGCGCGPSRSRRRERRRRLAAEPVRLDPGAEGLG